MGENQRQRTLPSKEELKKKEELDAREASVYSGLHPDYIRKLCREATIEARKVLTPGGFYFLVKRASLDIYLSVPHKPGPKRQRKREAEETPPKKSIHTEVAA